MRRENLVERMPGTVIPKGVDRIMRRVQSLTRKSPPTETHSDGEYSSTNKLKSSKSSRKFSAFAVSRSKSMSRMDALPGDIPQGCLAVYVGQERKRFVISTKYLSHELFKGLLKRSEEEFGFNHQGGLTIACDPVLFEHLLWLIGTDNPAARTTKLEELLDFYAF